MLEEFDPSLAAYHAHHPHHHHHYPIIIIIIHIRLLRLHRLRRHARSYAPPSLPGAPQLPRLPPCAPSLPRGSFPWLPRKGLFSLGFLVCSQTVFSFSCVSLVRERHLGSRRVPLVADGRSHAHGEEEGYLSPTAVGHPSATLRERTRSGYRRGQETENFHEARGDGVHGTRHAGKRHKCRSHSNFPAKHGTRCRRAVGRGLSEGIAPAPSVGDQTATVSNYQ